MIKIKSYKIQQQGRKGRVLTVPKVWIDDQNLKVGDTINFYRDEEDRLILMAEKQVTASN